MNIEANWKRGEVYFWVHKSTLAVHFLIGKFRAEHGGMIGKYVPLYYNRPKDVENYHRCRIDVVRTKKEVAQLNAKYAKKRAEFAKKLEAHVAKARAAQTT